MSDPRWISRLRRRLAEDETQRVLVDGCYRSMPPRQTLQNVAEVAVGVGITRVAAIDGLDRIGIPVFTAIRPTARSLATSQGKGISPDAAKASAVMEAIELWHAERHIVPWRLASYTELTELGEAVVDVERLVRCPCNEYAPTRPMRWTRALDLVSGGGRWVPYEAVHGDWRVPSVLGEHAVQNGTNGLAGGNTYTEAVVHALCELIERESIISFEDSTPGRQQTRRVITESIESVSCRTLLDRFSAAGVDVVIWDVTGPLGVAAFSCTAVETSTPWHQPLPQARGAGAHLMREIALQRALTEVAQARAAIIAGSRDDIFSERYREYFDPDRRGCDAAEHAVVAARSFASVPDARLGRARDDLQLLVRQLLAGGHDQVCIVDLTHPRWNVPVVKAIVPGLRWRPWEE